MARASYTALRSLDTGVTVNDAIDFDFEVTKMDRQTKVKRKDHIALSGDQVATKERTDEIYKVATSPVLEANFQPYRQFLDSVDGGEEFTFDPYGTFAAPVDPKTCVIDHKGYTEKRTNQRYLSVSFTVRVLP